MLRERAWKQEAEKQQSLERSAALQREIAVRRAEHGARGVYPPCILVLINTHSHNIRILGLEDDNIRGGIDAARLLKTAIIQRLVGDMFGVISYELRV